jgi:hypothetical protein
LFLPLKQLFSLSLGYTPATAMNTNACQGTTRCSHHTTTASTFSMTTPAATTPPDNATRGYKEPQAQNDVDIVFGPGKFSFLFHFLFHSN